MTTATIQLPPKLVPLFAPPRGELRYRVAYGGRGSGKSFTFALMAAIWGYAEPLRILCTRELQVSIKESMHAEIKNAIESLPWLAAHYEVGEAFIRGKNGTEFIFRGLRHNISAVKSMAQIDLCIVEEAADVPQHSWQSLLPTIRAPKSEVWAVYNPKSPTDPVDVMFRQEPPPRCAVVEINYSDNPWFPAELEEQRKHARRIMNPADYAWIWEGAYLKNSDAQIFANKFRVDRVEQQKGWNGPYIGLDHGFSTDPAAAVLSWVYENTLYIQKEAGGVGIELDGLAAAVLDKIPEAANHSVIADSARPDANSYLSRHGIPRIEGAKKGKGSVEDGIQFIRSFDSVVIDPSCKNVIHEFQNYSYKVDKLSGLVLPTPIDADNHWTDALRYSLEPIMKKSGYSWHGF